MISKVIIGKRFYGACRYICKDTKRAIILETEGVRNYDYRFMAEDFERQHSLRSTLSNAVFHGIISFYPGEKLPDQTMVEIAKEYLHQMKIRNTQFAIVKHIDKNHLHLHILANLVDNNGEVIKDNWIGLKGKKIAQKLTQKYKLKQVFVKDMSKINLEALNEKELNKYLIYQAILETIKYCKCLDDLKEMLLKRNIETRYKFKGQAIELQGISFKMGYYQYKGSNIDRKFSVINLQKFFYSQRVKMLLKKPPSKYSHLLPQRPDTEIKKVKNEGRDLFDSLMKIEKSGQWNEDNFELRIKKRIR